MLKIAKIANNKVINIEIFNGEYIPEGYEKYASEIHPWGPDGRLDIEIGQDWKERLKVKLGYCIFCGDSIITGSV